MINCAVVGIGGAIGSILRYLISLIPIKENFLFPIKTFAVNIIGCFLIGCVVAFVSKNSTFNPKLVLFLKTGLCGGFTTFSTFALETEDLIKSGHTGIAAIYVFLSFVVGFFAVFYAQKIIGD